MKDAKLTTGTLKQLNRNRVYQYIYDKKVTSKQQIVEESGLSLSTVSQNLAAMEAEGQISREGFFESTGGRKAQIIKIVPDYRVAIGVGLYKNELQIVSADLYGIPLHQYSYELSYQDNDAYYEAVTEHILQFIKDKAYRQDQILGVAIAVQGIVSEDGSRVLYGTILDNRNMKLDSISSALPYQCILQHDSKAAACLELWKHHDIDSAVVFLLNRNLGGAVIFNRKIRNGVSMRSGVIEHICIDPEGPECYCGCKGCLETYCSADALENISGMPADSFFLKLREGHDEKVRKIWDNYLHYLSVSVRNVNMLIDAPVIFSGYLSAYMSEQDLEKIMEEVNLNTPFPLSSDSFILGNNGKFTSTVGAAVSFIEGFVKDPTGMSAYGRR